MHRWLLSSIAMVLVGCNATKVPPSPPRTSPVKSGDKSQSFSGNGFIAESGKDNSADLGVEVYPGAVIDRDKTGTAAHGTFSMGSASCTTIDSHESVVAFYKTRLGPKVQVASEK